MKYFQNFLAGITHPVFLPIYGFISYHPLINKYESAVFLLFSIWYLFLYLILPVMYLTKVKRVNLMSPNHTDREVIYKTYMALGGVLVVISYFMLPEASGFFWGIVLMHLLLYVLAAIKLKASWHVAAAAYFLVASLAVKFLNNLHGQFIPIGIAVGLVVLVAVLRWQQKAHSAFEIGMGMASGAAAATLLLFI